MSVEEIKFPRYIRMDRKTYETCLNPLVGDKKSPFYKCERTGVYIMAACLGFKNGMSEGTKDPIDVRYFNQLSKQETWALFSIAVMDSKETDILLDGRKTTQIVEEYANGGAKLLYDKIFKSRLDFKLENEIIKILEKEKIQ
jgi:hypothetical protein